MAQEKSILDVYPQYEATIGIEVHVQLKTKTKLFCGCPNKFGEKPNKNICHVCTGQPGALPVLNRKVVDYAILAGLATGSQVSKISQFARKHYNYPDLPKNFQVTQGEVAICHNGTIPIELEDGSEKNIRLMRIHMEEDAGKNIHGEHGESFVDLNRAGTPLLEMVSEPDLSSAFEAKAYLNRVRAIVQYIGVSDANMEEGSFRADTNVSVKKRDATELGTRAELKNINSFKFIGQAIEYELKRQIELIEDGGSVKQETRQWDNRKNVSVPMRSKEEAQDYRYFSEPDIPVIMIDEDMLEKARTQLPELPHDKYKRFQEEYGLSAYEAGILVSAANLADFFEATVAICKKPKPVSNWMLRDLLGYLGEHKIKLEQAEVTPDMLAELVNVIDAGIINSKVASEVFVDMMETGNYPSIIIQEKDLKQIDSPDEIKKLVVEIIEANPDVVTKYKAGKTNLFQFFVGQTMKATKGKANPKVVQDVLRKLLG